MNRIIIPLFVIILIFPVYGQDSEPDAFIFNYKDHNGNNVEDVMDEAYLPSICIF